MGTKTLKRNNRLPEVVGVSPVTHNFALAVGRNQSAGVMVRGIAAKGC